MSVQKPFAWHPVENMTSRVVTGEGVSTHWAGWCLPLENRHVPESCEGDLIWEKEPIVTAPFLPMDIFALRAKLKGHHEGLPGSREGV